MSMIEELEGKPYSPGRGIRAMLGIENIKGIRHLPQRMHDYEKNYSPALKKLRGIGYAKPENAKAAAQMKGYRPGGEAYDNRNTWLPLLARQTTFQSIDDDYEEEIELSDEERKERLKKNPFYVDLSEEKEKEPPKQEDKPEIKQPQNNPLRTPIFDKIHNKMKFCDTKGNCVWADGKQAPSNR